MKNTNAAHVKLTFAILFITIFNTSYGQQDAYGTGFSSYESSYDRFASEFVTFFHDKMAIGRLNEKDIKGSAYLNPEFTLGTVYTLKNVHYTSIPLRYNIYNDVIEFKLQNDSIYAISNPEIIRQIEIEGETFFYYRTDYNKAGYYSLKYEGEVQLLLKYNIGFHDAISAAAFAEAKPAIFQPKANTFFIKTKDELPVRISRKNDLKNIFGNKSDKMLTFIKQKKLNIRKEDDLLKIVEFINQMK